MGGRNVRGCLVCVFKQPFLIFKQHFMYFHPFFHSHVFPQIFSNNNFQFLNIYTKQALNCFFVNFVGQIRKNFFFLGGVKSGTWPNMFIKPNLLYNLNHNLFFFFFFKGQKIEALKFQLKYYEMSFDLEVMGHGPNTWRVWKN